MKHKIVEETPLNMYSQVFGSDQAWTACLTGRIARLEAGVLDPKTRELVFVVGHLINSYGEAARYHQKRAEEAGATKDDFRLILKILDFYRGLRLFQDAQKLVSLWRTGNFPELKPPLEGSVQDIYAKIIESRKYVANGFRVYAADGEWLKLYLMRSDLIKSSPKSINEKLVQLISLAVTLKNHRFSNNWNDGCIQVHEDKSRNLGAGPEEILEVVQILEVCESIQTAKEAKSNLLLD